MSSRYSMGDDMKHLREESQEPDYYEDSWLPYKEELENNLRIVTVNAENKRLKEENKRLKEDNKRHITEKNQLGSKNHLLKTENAELRYRLSSYEENIIIIKGKILNAVRKKRNIFPRL